MTTPLLARFRHWLDRTQRNPAADDELLRRFAQARDEAAFAALVDRHGPMVLGVARRVVGDRHAAEDVLQATFLTLARRAARLRHPSALPAWLHRTAYHLAVTALRARTRRLRAEARATSRPIGSPLDELSSRELLAVLDEELHRLPDVLRLPLVLCCLEGLSQDEAAASLGWTSGSVKGRLERGRQRLKERLARRGLTFAAGAGTALLVTTPALSGSLRETTLGVALRHAGVPPAVAALAGRGSLLSTGWQVALVVAVAVVGAGLGVTALSTFSNAKPEAAAPPAENKPVLFGDPLPDGAVARFGSSHLRIGNSAFALTPDGKAIVTVAPEGGVVRKFDAKTGRLLERRRLDGADEGDPTGQSHAHLTPDGKTALLSGTYQGRGRMTAWDVESGKEIFRLVPAAGKYHGACGLSADGKQLAVKEGTEGPNSKQTLCVYGLPGGRRKELGALAFNVYRVRFVSEGKRVLVHHITVTFPEHTFSCFDVAAGKEIWRLPHKGVEFTVSPDGRTVVSASPGQGGYDVIDIDPDTGKPTTRFLECRPAHPNVRSVITQDNRTLVMEHFGEVVALDLTTGKETHRFPLPKVRGGYGPQIGALSPDGRTVVTNVGHLQRWALATGKPFFESPPDDGLTGPIERLGFSPDGKEVFARSWNHTAARWDVATRKRLSLLQGQSFGHRLTTTPAGVRGVAATDYRKPHEITLYDPLAGKALQTVRWTEPNEVGINGLRAYAMAADGKRLLVAHCDDAEKNTFVTTAAVPSGRRLARFAVPGGRRFLASPFSPCGRWVVLAGKVYHAGGAELFPLAGAADERIRPGNWYGESPLWFSPDSRLVAGFLRGKANDTLAVWEMATGKLVVRFPGEGAVVQLAFAPDGRTVALLDGRGVRLHDLATGKRRAAYSAPDVTCDHTDRGCPTQTLVFSPDGRTLATGHRDGSVLAWQVPAREAPTAIADGEREALWADLGAESPTKARAAVDRLARSPATAMALLAGKFRPVAGEGEAAFDALVKDLDSELFATREEASRKLRALGVKAEPALRRHLDDRPSLELKRRIEAILAAVGPPAARLPVSGDTLRGVRALEVLERIGTAEARKHLAAWAGQTRDMHLAVEARAVLERLGYGIVGR